MMSNEETLRFIENYRNYPELWDVNHRFYRHKVKRVGCLKALGEKYGLSVEAVKNKIKSLRSYFSKEHAKVTSKKSGPGVDGEFVSSWFAYKPLLFILDVITPNQIQELCEFSVEVKEEGPSSCENSQDAMNEEDVAPNDPSQHDPFIKPTPKSNLKRNGGDSFREEEVVPNFFEFQDAMNEEDVDPSDPSQHDRFRKPTPKRNLKRKRGNSFREEEAYNPRQVAASKLTSKDESDIFGEMVAIKVRKLTPRNRAIAQNRINNVLFSLEMEELDEDSSTSFPQANHVVSSYSPTPPSHGSYSSD